MILLYIAFSYKISVFYRKIFWKRKKLAAAGVRCWTKKWAVTCDSLKGMNLFSFTDCNISLSWRCLDSNARPALEDGQGSDAFSMSLEVAKGLGGKESQIYQLPETEKVLIPALVNYTRPSTERFLWQGHAGGGGGGEECRGVDWIFLGFWYSHLWIIKGLTFQVIKRTLKY